jgi:hypothetical protein
VPVKVKDSKPTAPQQTLATLATDSNGAIRTTLPRRQGHNPSIYFEVERVVALEALEYFTEHERWDSREKQCEVVAADGTVSQTDGHFENVTGNALVGTGERIRFRLGAPWTLAHLHLQYYDRESTGYVDIPKGVRVEAWEDHASASQALAVGAVGENGRVDLAVPKGDRNRYVRVVMRRTLSAAEGTASPPTAEVRKASSVVHWDTKGHTAVGGEAGTFGGNENEVGTRAAPRVFQIGAAGDTGGAADGTDAHAAPFLLKVVGEIHDWLRTRTGGDWAGVPELKIELTAGGANEGSRFNITDWSMRLNTARTVAAGTEPDHWNRAIVAHHYGHLVLERLYHDVGRIAEGVANHATYDPVAEQTRQLAFAEGWADYIVHRHLSTPTQPDTATPPTGWRGTDNDGADNSGEVVPVAVANALWQLDAEIVGQGHAAITDAVNQRRFQALIWNPVKSLRAPLTDHVPLELYGAIQRAALGSRDLIPPHDISHIRQQVRRIFEANGMVFTRGRITGAARQTAQNLGAAPPVPEVWRFQVREVALGHPGGLPANTLGWIHNYRIQAAPAGSMDFVDLEPVVSAPPPANQSTSIDVNLTAMRQSGTLRQGGNHDFRVCVQDEFGTWDTFADDFTGNTGPVGNTRAWQRDRLHSIHNTAINVP